MGGKIVPLPGGRIDQRGIRVGHGIAVLGPGLLDRPAVHEQSLGPDLDLVARHRRNPFDRRAALHLEEDDVPPPRRACPPHHDVVAALEGRLYAARGNGVAAGGKVRHPHDHLQERPPSETEQHEEADIDVPAVVPAELEAGGPPSQEEGVHQDSKVEDQCEGENRDEQRERGSGPPEQEQERQHGQARGQQDAPGAAAVELPQPGLQERKQGSHPGPAGMVKLDVGYRRPSLRPITYFWCPDS